MNAERIAAVVRVGLIDAAEAEARPLMPITLQRCSATSRGC